MKISVFLNNSLINDPLNINGLSLIIEFLNGSVTRSINLQELEFGVGNKDNDGFFICRQFLTNRDVARAIPLQIFVGQGQIKREIFNGFTNLASAEWKRDRVICKIFTKDSPDFLERASGFRFEYLKSIGVIRNEDMIQVPSVNGSLPAKFEAMLVILTQLTIFGQIKSEVKNLTQLLTESANPLEFTAIIRLVLQIAYIILLMVTLVIFVLKFIKLIISFVKYYPACGMFFQLKKGFEYLGYEFKSSIMTYYNDVYILPTQYNLPRPFEETRGWIKNERGYNGEFKGTLAELFNIVKQIFDAKVIVRDGVIQLEPQDFQFPSCDYALPNENLDEFSFNSEEFVPYKVLKYQVDINDKHTIDNYTGNICKAQVIFDNILPQENVLYQESQGQIIEIPFAHGIKKTELTTPEKVVNAILELINLAIRGLNSLFKIIAKVVNVIIKIINAIGKILRKLGINILPKNLKPINVPQIGLLVTPQEKRMDSLLMENDYIDVPKLLVLNTNGKLGHQDKIHASFLFDKFHKYRLSAENQYKIFKGVKVPFTFSDFLKIENNQFFKNGEFIRIEWDLDKVGTGGTAVIDYRQKYAWQKNISLSISTGN